MAIDRDLRKIINTKQDIIEFNGTPSLNGMSDGQVAITKGNNKQLAIYRKKFGRLWKSYMNYDGNEYVDKNLTVKNNITINSNLAVDGTATISGAATISGDINANGDIVGDDTTDITNINQIQCDEILHDGDTDTKITFTDDQIDFYAGNIKILTIDEAGADVAVFNEDGVDVNFRIESLNDVNMFKVDGGTDVVLIGRSSRAATNKTPVLEIDGYVSFDGFVSRDGTGASTTGDNGNNIMNFYWDGTYIDGWVDTTEVWPNETSDYRIKENIVDISDGVLEKINALKPIHFTQKEIGIFKKVDEQRVSFVAHELEEQFPDIVKGDKDAVDDNGNPIFQSYNNTQLTAYLIKAVQELTARVVALES